MGHRCDQEKDFYTEEKETAGLVYCIVYVSSDPLFDAKFTRSTQSIFTNKLWYESSKKKKKRHGQILKSIDGAAIIWGCWRAVFEDCNGVRDCQDMLSSHFAIVEAAAITR